MSDGVGSSRHANSIAAAEDEDVRPDSRALLRDSSSSDVTTPPPLSGNDATAAAALDATKAKGKAREVDPPMIHASSTDGRQPLPPAQHLSPQSQSSPRRTSFPSSPTAIPPAPYAGSSRPLPPHRPPSEPRAATSPSTASPSSRTVQRPYSSHHIEVVIPPSAPARRKQTGRKRIGGPPRLATLSSATSSANLLRKGSTAFSPAGVASTIEVLAQPSPSAAYTRMHPTSPPPAAPAHDNAIAGPSQAAFGLLQTIVDTGNAHIDGGLHTCSEEAEVQRADTAAAGDMITSCQESVKRGPGRPRGASRPRPVPSLDIGVSANTNSAEDSENDQRGSRRLRERKTQTSYYVPRPDDEDFDYASDPRYVPPAAALIPGAVVPTTASRRDKGHEHRPRYPVKLYPPEQCLPRRIDRSKLVPPPPLESAMVEPFIRQRNADGSEVLKPRPIEARDIWTFHFEQPDVASTSGSFGLSRPPSVIPAPLTFNLQVSQEEDVPMHADKQQEGVKVSESRLNRRWLERLQRPVSQGRISRMISSSAEGDSMTLLSQMTINDDAPLSPSGSRRSLSPRKQQASRSQRWPPDPSREAQREMIELMRDEEHDEKERLDAYIFRNKWLAQDEERRKLLQLRKQHPHLPLALPRTPSSLRYAVRNADAAGEQHLHASQPVKEDGDVGGLKRTRSFNTSQNGDEVYSYGGDASGNERSDDNVARPGDQHDAVSPEHKRPRVGSPSRASTDWGHDDAEEVRLALVGVPNQNERPAAATNALPVPAAQGSSRVATDAITNGEPKAATEGSLLECRTPSPTDTISYTRASPAGIKGISQWYNARNTDGTPQAEAAKRHEPATRKEPQPSASPSQASTVGIKGISQWYQGSAVRGGHGEEHHRPIELSPTPSQASVVGMKGLSQWYSGNRDKTVDQCNGGDGDEPITAVRTDTVRGKAAENDASDAASTSSARLLDDDPMLALNGEDRSPPSSAVELVQEAPTTCEDTPTKAADSNAPPVESMFTGRTSDMPDQLELSQTTAEDGSDERGGWKGVSQWYTHKSDEPVRQSKVDHFFKPVVAAAQAGSASTRAKRAGANAASSSRVAVDVGKAPKALQSATGRAAAENESRQDSAAVGPSSPVGAASETEGSVAPPAAHAPIVPTPTTTASQDLPSTKSEGAATRKDRTSDSMIDSAVNNSVDRAPSQPTSRASSVGVMEVAAPPRSHSVAITIDSDDDANTDVLFLGQATQDSKPIQTVIEPRPTPPVAASTPAEAATAPPSSLLSAVPVKQASSPAPASIPLRESNRSNVVSRSRSPPRPTSKDPSESTTVSHPAPVTQTEPAKPDTPPSGPRLFNGDAEIEEEEEVDELASPSPLSTTAVAAVGEPYRIRDLSNWFTGPAPAAPSSAGERVGRRKERRQREAERARRTAMATVGGRRVEVCDLTLDSD